MKKTVIVIVSTIVVLIYGVAFVLIGRHFGLWGAKSQAPVTTSAELTEKVVPEVKKETPADWGKATSTFGFSIGYPYKEVGAVFGEEEDVQQLSFIFNHKAIQADADTLENLSDDLHNLEIKTELSVAVIKPDKEVGDLLSWIKTLFEEENSSYGNVETTLSEQDLETTFSGQKGYIVIRKIEGKKEQKSPHYLRKDIFFVKDGYVYRISRLAASDDTVFPRSGEAGKEFLNYTSKLSSEILQTFVFDGSLNTRIVVPKSSSPKLTGEAADQREKLLAALRQGPYFDEQKSYPELSNFDRCDSSPSFGNNKGKSVRELRSTSGIYVSVSDFVLGEDNAAEIHGYDENGGHTGLGAVIPGFDKGFVEEYARNIRWTNLGMAYGLSIRENMNGKIEVRGKKFSIVQFSMNGEGNSCRITDFTMPVTPYSVATIPMTKEGDFGPISYDIDGDGVEDLKMSLIHPLLPEKEKQLGAVYSDLNENQ